MTSLAAQLQAVASAVPREEKLKGKASLLYDIREAADIDLATIYAVGVQGASPRRRARRSRRRRFTPADTSLGWRARRDGDAAPVESQFSRADARSTCRGTPEPEPRPSNERRRARARATPRRLPNGLRLSLSRLLVAHTQRTPVKTIASFANVAAIPVARARTSTTQVSPSCVGRTAGSRRTRSRCSRAPRPRRTASYRTRRSTTD